MRRCPTRSLHGVLILVAGLCWPGPNVATAAGVSDEGYGIAEVRLINDHIRRGWADHGLRPSAEATDGEWCRRVYLDVLGRVPTVAELQKHLADRSPKRRKNLVDRLLGNEYREQFARHWSTVWANTLIGRTGGATRDSLASRAGMEQYLRQSLQTQKSYDRMVYELITAEGSCRPEDEDFNGAANFLADKLAENGVQATAKTAQIFLGMAVQCTQCHNHPFNEYRQNQFWELNAFFRQTRVERQRMGDDNQRAVARIYDEDFAGEGRHRHWRSADEVVWEQVDGEMIDTGAVGRAAAPIYYELRNGQVKMAFPVFVDGTSLEAVFAERDSPFGNSGYLEHVDRREELAKLVVASTAMDEALINRMWGHFLGYGFTKPIDDLGPHNPPSHPELLRELGAAFRESSYDLPRLMRWIVLSEPYGLSSRIARGNEQDDPTLGAQPMFSRFYLRQMQAEQLYESLLVATGADQGVAYEDRRRIRQEWLDQFNTAFGTDENDEATTFNGSIPQALMLMNGDLVRQATRAQSKTMLGRVAQDSSISNPDKIRHLYLAAVARRPTREELVISNQLLAARQGNVAAALEDIWWALLNSNEFILVH